MIFVFEKSLINGVIDDERQRKNETSRYIGVYGQLLEKLAARDGDGFLFIAGCAGSSIHETFASHRLIGQTLQGSFCIEADFCK